MQGIKKGNPELSDATPNGCKCRIHFYKAAPCRRVSK